MLNVMMMSTIKEADHDRAQAFRELVRSKAHTGPTTGIPSIRGLVQANLVILPSRYSYDFLLFCQRNPRPCPLLDVCDSGSPIPSSSLAKNADLRTDVPKYRIYRDGILAEEVHDISEHWHNAQEEGANLVCFLLGCSFSFEEALLNAGIPIRHIEEGRNVSMFKTNIPCRPAGIFKGNLVVSMRPFKPADIVKVVQITSRYEKVHGSPLHIGYDKGASIGIKDLGSPDYGDAVTLLPGETPVFHACGVTPQNIILESKPSLAITHSPGCMFITDVSNESLTVG